MLSFLTKFPLTLVTVRIIGIREKLCIKIRKGSGGP